MKLALFLSIISIIFNSNVFGQDKKYQSLLWEISGNGLKKESYIYGTMHVSDKISYHLSTAFFDNLLKVDMVATESDPTTWAEVANIYSNPINYSSNKFYSSFYLFPITKDQLFPLFNGMNYNQSHLMSRTDEGSRNYQEDTYLDMFIYRTGRKYGKKCVGLEDAKQSMISIQQGGIDAQNVDFTYDEQSINRIQKNKSYQELIQEYYREKDLDMLDSITRLATHPKILEGLLYNRNTVMVNSIDSLMKEGSLFAAVGASHLPGTKGMIELLRELGYIVKPIFSDYTDEGRAVKKKIDELYIKPNLKLAKSGDGMVELPLFEDFSENQERLESADIVNGGYINVKRISHNDFLKKDTSSFNHLTLDSLFFESIPGDIIEKKYYNEKGVDIYDIKSVTKTKNAEHYRYYVTPLEIIAIIMGGEGNYVRQYEDLVFNNIKIKDIADKTISFSPKKGGFEIELPSYYKVIGDNNWNELYSDIEINAYDREKDNNFFLIERTLTDGLNLYNTEFELKRIAHEFLFQLDADTLSSSFDKINLKYSIQATIGEKRIQLSTIIKGAKYYLLGTVNTSETESITYFNSFKYKTLSAPTDLYTYHDKDGYFSIEIPKKFNENLDLNLTAIQKPWSAKNKFNIFEDTRDRFIIYNPTGETVELGYSIYSPYVEFKNRDQFWKELIDNVTSNFEDTLVNRKDELAKSKKEWNYDLSRWELEIEETQLDKPKYVLSHKELSEPNEKGEQVLTALIGKSDCSQATRIKCILTENSFYYLRAFVDKEHPNSSEFINRCFETMIIEPNGKNNSIFENTVDRFIADANSVEDSIRFSAMASVNRLEIDTKNAPQIIEFVKNYEFEADEIHAEFTLINKIIEVNEREGLTFLEKIYSSENVLPSTQLKVLKELAKSDDKQMCLKIQELLELDLPLSDNSLEIYSLFEVLSENKNSEVLFPDILQFYAVPEYNLPIIYFTEYAVDNNIISTRKLKSYKKLLLTNAKLEYKRLAAWKREQDLIDLEVYRNDYYDYGGNSAPIDELLSYMHILELFKKDKDVIELLTKIEQLSIDEYYLDEVNTQIKHQKHLDDDLINKLLSKENTAFSAYQALHHIDKIDNSAKYNQDSIAIAAIYQLNNWTKDKDSLTFIQTNDEQFKGLDIRYFFYKVTNVDGESEEIESEKFAGIAFTLEDNKINPQSFTLFRAKKFNEEDELSDYVNTSIDESLYRNVQRAYHGKFKSNYGGNYFQEDFYEDYYEGDYGDDEYYEEEYYEDEY